MTDSKIKRILGAELKVGDVVVLTDLNSLGNSDWNVNR